MNPGNSCVWESARCVCLLINWWPVRSVSMLGDCWRWVQHHSWPWLPTLTWILMQKIKVCCFPVCYVQFISFIYRVVSGGGACTEALPPVQLKLHTIFIHLWAQIKPKPILNMKKKPPFPTFVLPAFKDNPIFLNMYPTSRQCFIIYLYSEWIWCP